MPRIEINNVTFGYNRNRPLFKGLSLFLETSAATGKVVAIVGRSGSGKSSLLRLILGLNTPWSGTLRTTPLNLQIAFLPQEVVLFEHLSISENVRYFERIKATKKRVKSENIDQLADDLRMKDIVHSSQHVADLSGGERQRVSLLRALSVEPDVLCLDEPCSGLDVEVKREFLTSLRAAVQSRGILTLYVTHHADEALIIADEVVFIDRDASSNITVQNGSILSMLRNPPSITVRQFFGGSTLNTMKCRVSEGLVQLADGPGDLGRLTNPLTFRACLITFPPERIRFGRVGIPTQVIGTSGWFTFCEIVGDKHPVRLMGPSTPSTVRSLSLEGSIDIFELSGEFITSSEIIALA